MWTISFASHYEIISPQSIYFIPDVMKVGCKGLARMGLISLKVERHGEVSWSAKVQEFVGFSILRRM